MSTFRSLGFMLGCSIAAIASVPHSAQGQCSPGGLDDGPLQATKGGLDISVTFTDDSWLDCGVAGDYFPADKAQNSIDGLGSSYDRYLGLGFLEPYLNDLPNYPIYVYDSEDTGQANPPCVTMDAPARRCSSESIIRETLLHEMFHTIQRHYMCSVSGADCDSDYIGSTFGKWVAEATARSMQDHIFSDHDSASGSITFWSEVSNYMTQPDVSLFDQSYKACLFWSYCCEQLGSTTTEPERGVDFMRRFWEQIASNGTTDSLTALRDEIEDSGGGSMDRVFHDFAICNYTRQFDVSALPNSSRYLFIDEQPGNGGGPLYDNVARAGSFNSFPQNVSSTIAVYAAKYYEMTFTGKACEAVGFLGSSDQPIAWALVGVTPDNKAVILSKGTGRDYGRTFINSPTRPINRLGAIVIGLSEGSDYSFTFDVGAPRITIIRPTTIKPAYAGKASEPGRFLVRTYVDGPDALKPPGAGQRSIKGLRQEDFGVKVNNIDANVISAAYVGGEYWLTVQAPEQTTDGLYNLTVTLCGTVAGASVSATNQSCVLYADIRINHMIVIDKSGSMGDPADFSKLDAAKIAGSLYVDSVSDADRVGVVVFDGNGTDCDDDASTPEALGTATATKRNNAKTDIGNLTASGNTSIGDGLWDAQVELDPFSPATNINTIILLSDGEENEGRWWSNGAPCQSAASKFSGNGSIINTIAFGPESNQTLMQTIAGATGGDYSYVDVTDAAAAIAMSQADGSVKTMPNQLADAYMQGLQRSRSLERLFVTGGDAAAGQNFTIDVPVLEDGITQGTLFVNGSEANALTNLKLVDPTGHTIGAGDATFYANSTHGVWHLFNKMKTGTWKLSFSSNADTEYFVGLLGRQQFGVQMQLYVTQVNTGGLNKENSEGPYEQGVPVTILSVLTDAKGPILGARLDLQVRRPDGTFACGPLHLVDDGTQNDGEPDDGVYGAIFTDTSQAGDRSGVRNDGQPPIPHGTRGTYLVHASAVGESQVAGKFIRSDNTAFHIFKSRLDRDKDGLPDTWEVYYGTNPSADDSGQDTDGDGLTDKEEYFYGTNPFDQDTDGGGESDGSEVAAGRCPLERSDDLLPCPIDVEVVTNTGDEDPGILRKNSLLLRFPVHSSYKQMRIFRRKAGDPNFQLIKLLDLSAFKPPFYDNGQTGLVPGVEYEYRFQAVGINNALSCLSPIIHGTAKGQPRPPKPWAMINNTESKTDRLKVSLNLDGTKQPRGSSPKEYRASNQPLTPAVPYLLLPAVQKIEISWQLLGPVNVPGLKRVYIQYRDGDGNESEPILETIYYDPTGDADHDGQANNVDLDDDNDGLSDNDELQKGTDPFDPDTDHDGLSDGDEIAMGTNPRNPDTDGDGLLDGVDPFPNIAPNPPDMNGDGDVDGADYAIFMNCLTGPDIAIIAPNCAGLDFDADGDIDQIDFGVFQRCFSGSGKPADLNCKN